MRQKNVMDRNIQPDPVGKQSAAIELTALPSLEAGVLMNGQLFVKGS